MWTNHTQPQQPVTSSSCWSPARPHAAVGWCPILQPAFVTRQPVWFCRPLWHEHQHQADPTSARCGWGQDCRPPYPAEVSPRLRRYGIATGPRMMTSPIVSTRRTGHLTQESRTASTGTRRPSWSPGAGWETHWRESDDINRLLLCITDDHHYSPHLSPVYMLQLGSL